MIPYPNIDPNIISIGPVSVRWYGMMYLLGFAASFSLVKYQIRKKGLAYEKDFVESLYTYLVLGLLIGARLGYVAFYNLNYYIYRPLEIFAVWQGGMSFHGGLIGCFIAGLLVLKQYKCNFWEVADLVIVTAPVGLGFGRLGNFINAELYGRVTDLPWGMVFPGGGSLPRHPSQLYELFLEGVVLFVVLWFLKDRKYPSGVVTAVFIILYSLFRFLVEFVREPDAHIGFILGPFTIGQGLSFLMMTAGVLILLSRRRLKTGTTH